MAKRRTKKSNTPKRNGNPGIRLFVLVMLVVFLLGTIGGAVYLGSNRTDSKTGISFPATGTIRCANSTF